MRTLRFSAVNKNDRTLDLKGKKQILKMNFSKIKSISVSKFYGFAKHIRVRILRRFKLKP